MLFTSTIIAAASGSVGGLTASHNRFGKYFRTRAIPVNPNTPPQQEVKTALQTAAIQWVKLSNQARLNWDNYAQNTPTTNRIGLAIVLTGFNMFIRSNVPRIQAGLPLALPAPVTMGLPALNAVSLTATVTGLTVSLSLSFDATQAWTADPTAGLIIRASRPQSAATRFFKGPFQFTDLTIGDAVSPPTSPLSRISQFEGAVTLNQFVVVRLTDAEGRLSSAQIVTDQIT